MNKNTNMLSTLSPFSMAYAEMNSRVLLYPILRKIIRANTPASDIQKIVQIRACLNGCPWTSEETTNNLLADL
jgi:hypothetical protein